MKENEEMNKYRNKLRKKKWIEINQKLKKGR